MASMIDGDSRIIYVPVETRAREWDAKLLFSLIATAANFQAVLGPKWMLSPNRDCCPRGLYGFKTLNKLDASGMHNAKRWGTPRLPGMKRGPDRYSPTSI